MKDKLLICSYREFLSCFLHKRFPKARKEDIEDAVQNAIIKAVRFSDKWQGTCSLKTWISVIALNMYTDTFRKTYVKNEYVINSSEELFLFDQISVDDFSEAYCNSNYLRELVKDLMSGFENNVHVQAFNLNVVSGVDYKDIAIQQNIPLGTVKSRVFRGKKLLQEKYRELSCKYEESTV
jgi:RNA polymerase sigma-70 factor (ECF subfamily)